MTKQEILAAIAAKSAELLATEAGRVSGPVYRERYRIGGAIVDVAWYAGDIVAWAIRARRNKKWQVEL